MISEWYYIDPANRSRRAESVREDVSSDTEAKLPISPIAAVASRPIETAVIPASDAASGNLVGHDVSPSVAVSSHPVGMDVIATDDNETTVLYNHGAAASTAVM